MTLGLLCSITIAIAACGTDTVPTCGAQLDAPARTEAEVRPILARTCALGGCHLHAPGAGGLVLDARSSAWTEAVVGVASLQSPVLDLVVPHDPGASWLVRKLDGDPCGAHCQGGCGGRMPVGEALPTEERAAIIGWIAGGATRDP